MSAMQWLCSFSLIFQKNANKSNLLQKTLRQKSLEYI